MPRAGYFIPKFPAPSQTDMERILKEDPSKIAKNEITLWNVKLAENPLIRCDEVIVTRTRCISTANGLEIKENRFTTRTDNYQKLLELIKLTKWLRRLLANKRRKTADEGIELEFDSGSPIRAVCDKYHAFLKDNFSMPWSRLFLCELNLLKYEYDQ